MKWVYVAVVTAAQAVSAPVSVVPRLDTPEARVIVATLQPHMPAHAANGHATNRVIIYLDDGTMARRDGDRSETLTFRRGDVRWVPASGAYTAENLGDRPIRILEIDLKGAPSGRSTASPLDPTLVDPQHYKVAL